VAKKSVGVNMNKTTDEKLEWESYNLSQYVRICYQSYPGDFYTIGNPKTGETVHRKDHSNFREGDVGNEFLEVSRFVQSFPYEEAVKLLERFKNVDENIKVYHNFDWYAARLEEIEKLETSIQNEK
jgi:hypothetical protein